MISRRHISLSIYLLITLSIFSVLIRVSAADYPAIYISPARLRTSDPIAAVGTNYTISVDTDYTGSDLWGFEFTLTFNANVIEGADVVNGDLITEDDGPTMWDSEGFNNTTGELKLTGNGFFALPHVDPPVTSGPGTLANVTFTVVGYGISNITTVHYKLIGFDSTTHEKYNIIDNSDLGHTDDGIFYNVFAGDIDGDGDVDGFDLTYMCGCYGATPGHPRWDEDCDINLDDVIDGFDLTPACGNYGKTI